MGLRIPDRPQALANPSLGFRLDPGEPGVLRQASASDSTLRVAEQEGRNTRRLEAQALREGRVVTRSVRTFTRGPEGSFLTTVAGLTRVESVEPRPTPIENAEAIADARRTEPPPAETGPPPADAFAEAGNGPQRLISGGGGAAGLFNSGFRFANPDTAQVERDLVTRQAEIERLLLTQSVAARRADDPEAAADARQQATQLRRDAQAIEREINQIRLARLAENAQRLTQRFLEAADAQFELAAGLAGAALGADTGAIAPDTRLDALDLVA